DWSSDVCSSDLDLHDAGKATILAVTRARPHASLLAGVREPGLSFRGFRDRQLPFTARSHPIPPGMHRPRSTGQATGATVQSLSRSGARTDESRSFEARARGEGVAGPGGPGAARARLGPGGQPRCRTGGLRAVAAQHASRRDPDLAIRL